MSSSSPRRPLRRVLLAGVCALLGLVAVALAIPTAVALRAGDMKPRIVFEAPSPDAAHRVLVWKSAHFPVTEIVDPGAALSIEIVDVATGRALDRADVLLTEDSDFRPPVLSWDAESVIVSAFDARGRVAPQRLARRAR